MFAQSENFFNSVIFFLYSNSHRHPMKTDLYSGISSIGQAETLLCFNTPVRGPLVLSCMGFLEIRSLTNKTNDARPADQICCDVGEVGEDEDTQHLQGLYPPATQIRMMEKSLQYAVILSYSLSLE
jgi:hypothetical protein